MISKTLSRRLERLEAYAVPPDEPEYMTVNYVSGDGEIVDSVTFHLGQVRPAGPGKSGHTRRSRAQIPVLICTKLHGIDSVCS